MIAVSPVSPERPRQPAPQAPKLEELLPAVTRQACAAFRHLPAIEREELIAETVANCFVADARLVERGLTDVIYSTPLAQYAIRQVPGGRRVGAKLNKNDITSVHCRRCRRVRVERLQRGDADARWHEVLVEDHSAGPAEIAAIRIDFRQWLGSLTANTRRVAETLAAGESTASAARQFRVSSARISQLRRELLDRWKAFQGEPVSA